MEIHDLIMMPGAETHTAFLLNLIGGIFARKDAQKRDAAAAEAAKVPVVTTHNVDLQGMVRNAQAAGFNPMSILQNGGLAGWTTTSTTGQNAMAAVPTAPSMGSVIAGAAIKTMDQIGSFMSGGGAAMFAPTPMPSGSGYVASSGAFTGNAPMAQMARNAKNPFGYEQKPASQTSAMPWLGEPDPKYADTEAIETAYGEPISWLYGAGKLYNDAVGWVTGTTANSRALAIDSGINRASTLATDAVDYVEKWLDGKASGQEAKPPTKDTFSDPFPAWQW